MLVENACKPLVKQASEDKSTLGQAVMRHSQAAYQLDHDHGLL